MSRFVRLALASVLVTAAIAPSVTSTSPAGAADTIEPGLLAALRHGTARTFVVELGARADLNAATTGLAGNERAGRVHNALTDTAHVSQAAVLSTLRRTPGVTFTSYWLHNEVIVRGGAALAEQLAAQPGVTRVRAERVVPLLDWEARKSVHAAASAVASTIEENVQQVHAPQAWARGITGSGVVVASIDTGVDYTHPALVDHYRGNLGDRFVHDHSWFDAVGECAGPCDLVGHGTHTMGTILGGDGLGPFARDIGVAPGAQWIAARACSASDCLEGDLLAAGQWVLAPTDSDGRHPDPAKRPSIVSNSWGGFGDDPFFQDVVNGWRAAGIVPVFAAGNSGPACGTLSHPGNYANVIGVGAAIGAPEDEDFLIALFSSRGVASNGRVGPDVVAPGVAFSSVPGGGYDLFIGTSMAAPHVAGIAALLMSADPGLSVDAVTSILHTSANHKIVDKSCGYNAASGRDGTFGFGFVDASKATDTIANRPGSISGVVRSGGAAVPYAQVAVTVNGRVTATSADSSGRYKLTAAAGTWAMSVSRFGFASFQVPATISPGGNATLDVALTAVATFTVTGTVRVTNPAAPLPASVVRVYGVPVPAVTTDSAGRYSFALPAGTYQISAGGGCAQWIEHAVTVNANVVHDFAAPTRRDAYGHECRPVPYAAPSLDKKVSFDSHGIAQISIPFSFPFYNKQYRKLYLSKDGWLTFTAPPSNAFDAFAPLPSPAPPNGAIFVLGELGTTSGTKVQYTVLGKAPSRELIVRVTHLALQRDQVDIYGFADFQVTLRENGTIDVGYGALPAGTADGSRALIGIESPTASDALQVGRNERVIAPFTAIRYQKAS